MRKKVLLLGHTGKMGVALSDGLSGDYTLEGKNSRDFDAADPRQVRKIIEAGTPDILINAVAILGIDPCEKEPQKAFLLNTLYPKLLAELSREKGFLLVHFSTDAVFNDAKGDFYTESDGPRPMNTYGLTKYGGDCFVQAIAARYYIFRLPVLFGETSKGTQFVEKMLDKVKSGSKVLHISADIVSSPTYSHDAASEIKRILEAQLPFGLYHLANQGKASLYELIAMITACLGLDIKVEKASYRDFPFAGLKNTFTPLKSEKIASLRPWEEAVREYCAKMNHIWKGN